MRFGFWEIILILVLVFILFGSQKFPNMMRNLAEGINVFKKEMGGRKESKSAKAATDKKGGEVSAAKPVGKKSAKKPALKKVAKKKQI
ncbi:MAG: twin-arginine translocase TatA/TatE family subunit [Rickettsiales bacterium]|jgi:sec-independent protein translocase protein TatA|nr:twin-arginine translocase TatA/TatE family subunit [Rickettsiales bacterium]